MRYITLLAVTAVTLLLVSIWGGVQASSLHQEGGGWSSFENISLTSTSSTYPAVAGDRQGNVHVVWVEDPAGDTRNYIFNPDGSPLLDFRGKQINLLNHAGNTLGYTRWDGQKWLIPTDFQVAAAGLISFPSIAVDVYGTLHVVYLSGPGRLQDMFYTSAPAGEADQVRSWSQPVILTGDIVTTYFPVSLVADSTGGLHILYFQIGSNPGVFSISSDDAGENWSAPVLLYANSSSTGDEDGSMPVRLTIDAEDRLHATWTRYDHTGNGKAVYYAQSKDGGETWSEPFEAAIWRRGMYETDWMSVGVTGDEIHLVWEGGEQAFLNERVSVDGGVTWSSEQRILPRLVGENGWADVVTDSDGKLHLVVVKRISRSGFTAYGAWHTTWAGGQWASPLMIDLPRGNLYDQIELLEINRIQSMLQGTIMGDGMRYQRSVIVNGNELFTVLVNEFDGEIYSSRTVLPADTVDPTPYWTQSPGVQEAAATAEQAAAPQVTPRPTLNPTPAVLTDTNDIVWLGVAPVVVFILGFTFARKFIRQRGT